MKIKVLKEANTAKLQDIGQSATQSSSKSPAGATFRDDDATASSPKVAPSAAHNWDADPLVVMLREMGFEGVKFLGSGMMGRVYKVKSKENGDHAVKVVKKGEISTGRMKWSGEKEIRAYNAIKKVRGKSKEMMKHFPKVFFVEQKYGYYVIGLELLTEKGVQSFKLKDLFQGPEAGVDPKKDMMAMGAWKDLRRRIYTYFSNDSARNQLLDDLLEKIPEDLRDEIKSEANQWYTLIGGAESGGKESKHSKRLQPRIYEMIPKYVLSQDEDVFLDEFGNLKREFEEMPGVAYFLLKILKRLKEYRPTRIDPVWQDVQKGEVDEMHYWLNASPMVNRFANFIKKDSPVPMHHKPGRGREERAGAKDKIAAAFPEAASIRKALEDFEKASGLVPWDMHDQNAMIRPSDGSVVIVDAGLFRPRGEIRLRESKSTIKCKIRRKKRICLH